MFTFVTWPVALLSLSAIWLILLFGRRSFLRTILNSKIKSFDLLLPIFLWVLQSVSFQVWRLDILAPLLLAFVLWGIGMALWQGFVSQRFTTKYFFRIWWRTMGLVACLVTIILIALAVLS